MKIKITQTTSKEVEIELPHFTKSLAHIYKVVSETDAIQISCSPHVHGIQRGECFVDIAFHKDNVKTDEHDFNEHYEAALHKLAK